MIWGERGRVVEEGGMSGVKDEPSDRHVAFPQDSHDLGERGRGKGGRRGRDGQCEA